MNKKITIIVLIVIVGALALGYFLNTKTVAPTTPQDLTYTNSQYGFSFSLPQTWEGYSIVEQTWEGQSSGSSNQKVEGPMILIRNPKWTASTPYQDIPVMVFTKTQWTALQQGMFHIGAAPINPSPLGENAAYVFALPARYNYAYPAGWEEVEQILATHPLHAQ